MATATNINVDEFISLLFNIKKGGANYVNLDMIPDETRPHMNKLVIHPVRMRSGSNNNYSSSQEETPGTERREKNFIIRNPNISTDNDEIFDLFDRLV